VVRHDSTSHRITSKARRIVRSTVRHEPPRLPWRFVAPDNILRRKLRTAPLRIAIMNL
jgi:hypothetical protein